MHIFFFKVPTDILLLLNLPHVILIILTVQHFGRVSSDEHDSKRSEQKQYEIC